LRQARHSSTNVTRDYGNIRTTLTMPPNLPFLLSADGSDIILRQRVSTDVSANGWRPVDGQVGGNVTYWFVLAVSGTYQIQRPGGRIYEFVITTTQTGTLGASG
jgi:hypothetical protein